MIRNHLETSRINAVHPFKHNPCRTAVGLTGGSWAERREQRALTRRALRFRPWGRTVDRHDCAGPVPGPESKGGRSRGKPAMKLRKFSEILALAEKHHGPGGVRTRLSEPMSENTADLNQGDDRFSCRYDEGRLLLRLLMGGSRAEMA